MRASISEAAGAAIAGAASAANGSNRNARHVTPMARMELIYTYPVVLVLLDPFFQPVRTFPGVRAVHAVTAIHFNSIA